MLVLSMGLFGALLATTLALNLSVPVQRLVVDAERFVAAEARFGDAPVLPPGTRIVALAGMPADFRWFLEEPDVLPDYRRFNAFLDDQTRLATALSEGRIAWVDADGGSGWIPARERRLVELPWLFWLQLAFGIIGLVLGAGIWAFRSGDVAARLYALTGLGYALAVFPAAVYSTRELALDGDLFRMLSAVNHAGAILFAAALLGLVWHYPRPLRPGWPVARVALAFTALAVASDTLQWLPKPLGGMQTAIFMLFLPCFPIAFIQWWRARHRPVDRAALIWFFMSLFSGTTLFAVTVLLPPLLGHPIYAPQSLMLGVFLFVYAGIALALLRYRLFDVERWWFNTWIWVLGGCAVLLLDAALLLSLPLTGVGATGIALAVVGWLYFPVRQWLWRRNMPAGVERIDDLLPDLVAAVAAARDTAALRRIYREQLVQSFKPLQVDEWPQPVAQPRVDDDAQRMLVPELDGRGGLALRYPDGGGRLFAAGDLALAAALLTLVRHAVTAIDRREQSIESERQRIMRDLHDDLAGKLLALGHSGDESAQRIARSALQDVRDILQALEAGPTPLSQLLDACRWELQSRAEAHGFELRFPAPEAGIDDPMLGARTATNIARILREAVTNAVRHARTRRIDLQVRRDGHWLHLRLWHDGEVGDPQQWRPGRGSRTIRSRAADLRGEARWLREGDGVVLQLRVDLTAESGA